MGVNFLEEQAPDATTVLKFRHLLEKHQIGEKLFKAINELLEVKGCMLRGGTIKVAPFVKTKNQLILSSIVLQFLIK
jgi:IS5 family transposase